MVHLGGFMVQLGGLCGATRGFMIQFRGFQVHIWDFQYILSGHFRGIFLIPSGSEWGVVQNGFLFTKHKNANQKVNTQVRKRK